MPTINNDVDMIRDGLKIPGRIFNHSAGEFSEHFNRFPFALSHNLGNHPLFELPRLGELAKTLWALAGSKVIFQDGDAAFGNRWDEIPTKLLSFMNGIRDIQESGSWILLKSVQEDPDFKECIDNCLRELSELAEVDFKKEITWVDGYIFIASPRAVTPHHIDHESNFLLQIHGNKDFNVCDPHDRTLLFEEEIEKYYAGDLSAARYKSVSQEKALRVRMAPGTGVHIPSKGPHWVRNDEHYSVSFSINFCMRETDTRARVYQCNHFLRKLGFEPTPPGRSSFTDKLKILALAQPFHNKATNKNELLRRNLKRLERISKIAEKVLRKSPVAESPTAS